jgi:osmotically inducible protein OsmC
MAVRKAHATWNGNLKGGSGSMALGSGAFEGNYSFSSRFEDGTGTNPEELIGAAHAGCYSMALSHMLAEAGYEPKQVCTCASVHLDPEGDGFAISKIELTTEADIPGISPDEFQKHAADAKANCPVSKALAGVDIVLDASLAGS